MNWNEDMDEAIKIIYIARVENVYDSYNIINRYFKKSSNPSSVTDNALRIIRGGELKSKKGFYL